MPAEPWPFGESILLDPAIVDPAAHGLPAEAAGCALMLTWFASGERVMVVVDGYAAGMAVQADRAGGAPVAMGTALLYWFRYGWPGDDWPVDAPPEWIPVNPPKAG
jgi:hypothetical protein